MPRARTRQRERERETMKELLDFGKLRYGGEMGRDSLDEALDQEMATAVASIELLVVVAEEFPREVRAHRIAGHKSHQPHRVL